MKSAMASTAVSTIRSRRRRRGGPTRRRVGAGGRSPPDHGSAAASSLRAASPVRDGVGGAPASRRMGEGEGRAVQGRRPRHQPTRRVPPTRATRLATDRIVVRRPRRRAVDRCKVTALAAVDEVSQVAASADGPGVGHGPGLTMRVTTPARAGVPPPDQRAGPAAPRPEMDQATAASPRAATPRSGCPDRTRRGRWEPTPTAAGPPLGSMSTGPEPGPHQSEAVAIGRCPAPSTARPPWRSGSSVTNRLTATTLATESTTRDDR
jgi:hypothetical protein